jgi:hypothetical protein
VHSGRVRLPGPAISKKGIFNLTDFHKAIPHETVSKILSTILVMNRISLIVLMIFISSCKKHGSNNISQIWPQQNSRFSLITGLYDFPDRMNSGDTIVIHADLSVCASTYTETVYVTKENNDVYLTTFSRFDGDFLDSINVNQGKSKFIRQPDDTLKLESLFLYLKKDGRHEVGNGSPIFTITNKEDTIQFWSNGFVDRLRICAYYIKIMAQTYPDFKLYKPVPPPSEEASK